MKMKKRGNFEAVLWVVIYALLITSCEQPDGEAEFINTNDKNGFENITENSDIVIDENQLKTITPVLHIQFDEDVNKEEATTLFDKAVADYKYKNNNQNKGVSTEWFYRIATLTGNQSENDTDGNVRVSVYFNTDKGGHSIKNIVLDYPHIDERELGKWDYYLFKTSLPGQAVNWVQLTASTLQLQGTDDWFVKQFHTYLVAGDQTAPATGATNLYTFPNVWLDSSCTTCWDSYKKRGGNGTLSF